MQKEKLEQLRKIFEREIRGIANAYFKSYTYWHTPEELDQYIRDKASQLVYEVKIRMTNRKED